MQDAISKQDVVDLIGLKYLRRPLLKSERDTERMFHQLVQEQVYNLQAEEQFILSRLEEIQREKSMLLQS